VTFYHDDKSDGQSWNLCMDPLDILVAKKRDNNGQERRRSDLEHKLALIPKQLMKMK